MTTFLRIVCLCATLRLTPACAAGIDLADLSRLDPVNARVESVTYHGRAALKMTEKDAGRGDAFAILKDLSFHDGVIELDVSGAPSKTADATARGFIGILFRLQPDGVHSESMYLRPVNGRAEDQLAA